MLKKIGLYLVVGGIFFAGQFLRTSDLVTGTPPTIHPTTLTGLPAMPFIEQGPAILYFWGSWCGVCTMMQDSITAISSNYSQLTVALRSGTNDEVQNHLLNKKLTWSVVNDPQGKIAQTYGVKVVPAIFFLNKEGHIVFTSVGYSTEWGLRLRAWLAGFL